MQVHVHEQRRLDVAVQMPPLFEYAGSTLRYQELAYAPRLRRCVEPSTFVTMRRFACMRRHVSFYTM